MATGGYSTLVAVSTNDSTYSGVDGINSVTFGASRDLIDVTDFSSSGAMDRLAAMKDGSITISGHYEDDTSQVMIRQALMSRTAIYVRFLWNGTNGHKATCVVESYELGGEAEGALTFSATFQFNSAITAI